MKHLRIVATPEPERAPPFFNAIARSEHVTEARAIDWNVSADDVATLLYEIDGDAERLATAMRETSGIESVDLADGSPGYALAEVRPSAIPLFRQIAAAMARAGLIVRKPVIYRDGRTYSRVVGDPGPLQAALDRAPGDIDVRIDEIGRFPDAVERPAGALSDRQREAVETALALGYYDSPRSATHEDVAAELGCAPSTASEHLRKAEAALVRAAMSAFDPPR